MKLYQLKLVSESYPLIYLQIIIHNVPDHYAVGKMGDIGRPGLRGLS